MNADLEAIRQRADAADSSQFVTGARQAIADRRALLDVLAVRDQEIARLAEDLRFSQERGTGFRKMVDDDTTLLAVRDQQLEDARKLIHDWLRLDEIDNPNVYLALSETYQARARAFLAGLDVQEAGGK